MEVSVIAIRIEVGHTASKLNRGENAAALLGADLLSGSRK